MSKLIARLRLRLTGATTWMIRGWKMLWSPCVFGHDHRRWGRDSTGRLTMECPRCLYATLVLPNQVLRVRQPTPTRTHLRRVIGGRFT